jgi:hypothetical protein
MVVGVVVGVVMPIPIRRASTVPNNTFYCLTSLASNDGGLLEEEHMRIGTTMRAHAVRIDRATD